MHLITPNRIRRGFFYLEVFLITTQQKAAFKIVFEVLAKSDHPMAPEISDCMCIFLVDENAICEKNKMEDATTEECVAYGNYILSRPIGAIGLSMFSDWVEMQRKING
jgi:hypothetical protein